jgi:hypothetical protein
MVGEKLLEARKGRCSRAFARGSVLQLLDDLRQACPPMRAFVFQRCRDLSRDHD